MKMSNSKKGFTLIEMLVVIAIMGILMSVMAIEYGSYVDQSEQAVFEEEFRQIITAIDVALASRSVVDSEGGIITKYSEFTTGEEIENIYNEQFEPDLPVNSITIKDELITYQRNGQTANFNYLTRKFE